MRPSRNALSTAAGVLLIACTTARADDTAIPDTNPFSEDRKAIKEGRDWYQNVCHICHGSKANGETARGGRAADLRVFNRGFRAFVETVKKGRNTTGLGYSMPTWGGVLDDQTIYQIGAYLETLAIEGANWKEGKAPETQ
ncbi:MAG TPA: c-type cytochrome [Steroidobacteraceae bacterium]|nr:c-type cytochrome [Steroidobacteraceae bacterium]